MEMTAWEVRPWAQAGGTTPTSTEPFASSLERRVPGSSGTELVLLACPPAVSAGS